MNFKYSWKQKEANFGVPVKTEVSGGTHIACELVLKCKEKYLALRRPQAVPKHEIPEKARSLLNGALYFVHGLPRWGEEVGEFVTA